MVQINDEFYVRRSDRPPSVPYPRSPFIPHDAQEDLTPESIVKVLDDLAAGKKAKTGPQSKRKGSEPDGPLTALNNIVRRTSYILLPHLLVRRSGKSPRG